MINLTKSFVSILFFNALNLTSIAQCGNDPTSGLTTVSTANQINNSYFSGTGNPVAGNTTITVGALDARGNATTLSNGDLVLIIQMQGAGINATNTDAYGDGVSGGNASGYMSTNLYAGIYEYNTVASFSSSVITFSYAISNNYYTQVFSAGNPIRQFQVIRVPREFNITINSGASITAPAWNGSTGGVVALDAANTFTDNGAVNVTGLGFRGGGGKNFVGATTGNTNGTSTLMNTDYRWDSPATNVANQTGGAKGEGVAGTPAYVLPQNATTTITNSAEGYVNGSMGRSAAGNGGGGATDGIPVGGSNNQYNTGGGGGGNAGTGGNGGSGWHGGSGTSATFPYGGYGATGFLHNSMSRFVMGGGGGAGTANNSNSANEYQSSGGCGGGIIILRAKLFAGYGSIVADGGDAPGVIGVGGTANTDAAGGGGAGGTIIAVTRTSGTTGLYAITASAKGGKGGDMTNYYDHGPGGGGGGGIIYSNGTFASTSVIAGSNGLTRTGSTSGAITNNFGALPGTNGIVQALNGAPVLINSNNMGIPCGTLPITLTNFYAVAKTNAVTLFWQVETALNFSYFEVEYSTDGNSFSTTGKVSYQSNKSLYQFVHNINANVLYYRLKMVDLSGGYAYSKIIVVRMGNDVNSGLLFPNPAKHSSTLQFTSILSGKATISIMDAGGKLIYNKTLSISSGTNFYTIDCSTFSAGTYLIRLTFADGNTLKQRLIVSGKD